MTDINIIKEHFPNNIVEAGKLDASFNILEVLSFMKNCPELSFDMLVTIIAVDYIHYTELIYCLLSTHLNESIKISVKTQKEAKSVTSIYKSAYFDECEIYDLFGIKFSENPNLKRLLMPKSWVGHPLKKDYVLNDERLKWNE